VRLLAKAIRISRAKFHCNRLTTVQDIQDYMNVMGHIVVQLVMLYVNTYYIYFVI